MQRTQSSPENMVDTQESVAEWQEHGIRHRVPDVLILALPLISCVTSGMFINHPVPLLCLAFFPICEVGNKNHTSLSKVVFED